MVLAPRSVRRRGGSLRGFGSCGGFFLILFFLATAGALSLSPIASAASTNLPSAGSCQNCHGGAPSVSNGSSGNGLGGKSASQIISLSTSATKSASSFTLNGTVKEGRRTVGFQNLALSESGNAQGSLTIDGSRLQIVEVSHVLYVNGSKAFWTRYSNSAVGELLGGRWVFGGTTNKGLGSLAQELNPQALTQQFGSAGHGTYNKGRVTTVAGERVISVNGSQGSKRGVLYVALTGQPYIVRVAVKENRTGGYLTFTNYNQSVNTSAPPNPIDLSKLQQNGAGA